MDALAKRAYAPPQLTVFGSVEELTQSGCWGGKSFSATADDHRVNNLIDQFNDHFGTSIPNVDNCSIS